jgi:hypothetical protein
MSHDTVVRYYYRQWSSFMTLPESEEHTYSLVWREINGSPNLV